MYLVAGLCLLLAVVLPPFLRRAAVSAPMVLVGVGLLIGLSPLPELLRLDAPSSSEVLHLTELTVLVALMGVGLALDRPLDVRSWRSWTRWTPAWRLLAITMPLTIAAVAVLGWWAAGLTPAAAVALGAVLAPTDPVLASDVQVGGPTAEEELEIEDEADEPDELRFALTAEAGLNDGLAFPFVHLALLMGAGTLGASGAAEWLGWYVLGKVVVGVAVGVLTGWALGRVAFRSTFRLAEYGEPLLALAALLSAYGAAEVAHGYGFLAVFACAMSVRAHERGHEYHAAMHAMIERLEVLLTLVVLLALGIATTRGLLEHLDLRGVLVGVALVFVIRPLTGLLGFAGSREAEGGEGLTRGERAAAAFFGVRGVGSLFYVAYVATHGSLEQQPWLWSTVAFTVVLSVFVHGILATPVLRRLSKD